MEAGRGWDCGTTDGFFTHGHDQTSKKLQYLVRHSLQRLNHLEKHQLSN